MVGASVQRWIWVDGTLKDACESLRFFYGENIHLARPEERCRVSAPFAENVRDCALVYSCAFHARSEEHTSELQSLMRISYAVFFLKKKNIPLPLFLSFFFIFFSFFFYY